MRWLYHVVRRDHPRDGTYTPESLSREGFVHASYLPSVAETARLYFAPDADVVVLQINPRYLDARVEVSSTPRGPMPHIHGTLNATAIAAVLDLRDLATAPDVVVESSIDNGRTA